ncbi:MAG: DUF262 domain-containing protein, partial [Deltaproteobacteria bacterium]|nr:DUF262 domain-containing protein [Deltaproteobacteria bacterium]
MKLIKESIRKVVSCLNNPDENGGYWLPHIQREFVWNEKQICSLFDSITRSYPINTMLIWRTNTEIRHRKFIDNYHHGIKLTDQFVLTNNKSKYLVLDGQQRLQSLLIGLKGSYNEKELFLDVLNDSEPSPDNIKYKFSFLKPEDATFPNIKVKDIVYSLKSFIAKKLVISMANHDLSDEEKYTIENNVENLWDVFNTSDGVGLEELDSIEYPDYYTLDDVLEIFIRTNSGGTPLSKSDLLFSLLNRHWDIVANKMETLLSRLNRHGFKFSRDFVLKSCLTIFNRGASYDIEKFRKTDRFDVRAKIVEEWTNISNALLDVMDFLMGKTFIRSDKALTSYNALIPLVYFRYHYHDKWKNARGRVDYLLISLLSAAFSGNPDRIIDECVKAINQSGDFNLSDIKNAIIDNGHTFTITPELLWSANYGSRQIHLLFNFWYKDFNYTPAFDKNMPEIDHIFPKSALIKIKIKNRNTGIRNITKYKWADRNQLANCMLLTQEENGAGGKSDTLPEIW